ncbi:ABC transporter permease [Conexibacter woesei]|uniref:Inner-membrane translocator n=1 Tax=Conexibacter woesei (strain DSM 14684 / CCUG 47730 / CIP 108061 / JCM 11494 / NBRC 100937 / ID131577) TaxID=469383 RepID=D3F9A6_CONWI|nr:ABC transporter permease [Conexibacter woesei]ADB49073.1 inner-membrane translocator [Conexibacter woesei DSM 14684]
MFVHDVLQDATPFILAAMGGLVAERAGIINIGLEGIMLVGALAAMLLAHYTHSPLAGVAGAVLIGMMFVSIMGVFHLHFGADMILAGFALNLLATGGTVYVLWLITGETGNALSLESYPLGDITLPVVDGIPVLKGLSQQSPIVYLALLSLPFTAWLLYRTRSGIHMRAVGESEDAVIEAGLNPRALRWRALLLSGGFCALAGAQLSMSTTTTFVRDMTAGRGFIALGAVYLGAKHPVGTFIAALIFGVFEALAITLQIHTQVPTDLVLMLPYVATVAALVVDGLRRRRARNALTAVSA